MDGFKRFGFWKVWGFRVSIRRLDGEPWDLGCVPFAD